ncbi:peptidase family M48-domain-containing protein [Chaetomium tenue]|uniref:Peptidase family M48-domain-containing protein n=1 Tax=Chaetomium tenue TaxID=1854479 RepID=A0ACB7PL58_9PEZI|nr:peptidase family M48-domain-containing protein [Chaetomium globosum]
MLKVLRPRPFLAQGSSAMRRLRPPPSRPIASPLRVTTRCPPFSSPYSNQQPPHTIELFPPRPSLPRPFRPPTRPTPITLPHPQQHHHHHQHRTYNYHPNNHNRRTPPPQPYSDPAYRDARLLAAKPLLHWRGFRALHTPTTYTILLAVGGGLAAFYFAHLETVPVSGRTRFNAYGAASVRRAGELEHRRLLWEMEQQGVTVLPEWDGRVVRVRRVMERLLLPFRAVVGLEGMEGEEWEVSVVDDPRTANAFVLPGGKVFVFSGILGLARNDSGLATVLGHEIAHNLAGHHGERLSQDIKASVVLYTMMVLGGAFGLGPLIMHYFGSRFLDVAFGFPMSRLQESEADYIGLMMMAEACYDPQEAARFWARMEKATGQEMPEWMSTHPANMNRIKKIQEWLPEAMEKRAQSDCSSTTAFADLFKHAMRTGQVFF